MATKQETAEIKSSLERINENLANLAELITGQQALFGNLASAMETNHTDHQRQIDTLKRRVDTAYEMITESMSIARSALEMAKEANELSRQYAGSIGLSRELASHSREMLNLAQQQLESMRAELTAINNNGNG